MLGSPYISSLTEISSFCDPHFHSFRRCRPGPRCHPSDDLRRAATSGSVGLPFGDGGPESGAPAKSWSPAADGRLQKRNGLAASSRGDFGINSGKRKSETYMTFPSESCFGNHESWGLGVSKRYSEGSRCTESDGRFFLSKVVLEFNRTA